MLVYSIIAVAVVYGLVFGSFANAVAYRVPTGETLWTRSHCPKCDAQIKAWQNIPVLSWLFLRGKCANCKEPISIQYPAIELLTGVLFGLLTWFVIKQDYANFYYFPYYSIIPPILIAVVLCYFAFIGVVLSIIDFKTMTLPTKLIYSTWIGSIVLLSIASYVMKDFDSIKTMLIGGAASMLFYGIIWFVVPRGFGFGDVRLVLLTGSILGWFGIGHAVLGVMLPFILSSIVMVPLLLLKVVDRKTKVPLGPWIIAATIITVFFGDIIVNTYLSIGGF